MLKLMSLRYYEDEQKPGAKGQQQHFIIPTTKLKVFLPWSYRSIHLRFQLQHPTPAQQHQVLVFFLQSHTHSRQLYPLLPALNNEIIIYELKMITYNQIELQL